MKIDVQIKLKTQRRRETMEMRSVHETRVTRLANNNYIIS